MGLDEDTSGGRVNRARLCNPRLLAGHCYIVCCTYTFQTGLILEDRFQVRLASSVWVYKRGGAVNTQA